MCCMWMQMWMSRKEKEKTYFNADGWIVDVLHMDALVCGHEWWWMLMVMDSNNIKEKEKRKLTWWGISWMQMDVVDADDNWCRCVQDLDNFCASLLSHSALLIHYQTHNFHYSNQTTINITNKS